VTAGQRAPQLASPDQRERNAFDLQTRRSPATGLYRGAGVQIATTSGLVIQQYGPCGILRYSYTVAQSTRRAIVRRTAVRPRFSASRRALRTPRLRPCRGKPERERQVHHPDFQAVLERLDRQRRRRRAIRGLQSSPQVGTRTATAYKRYGASAVERVVQIQGRAYDCGRATFWPSRPRYDARSRVPDRNSAESYPGGLAATARVVVPVKPVPGKRPSETSP